MRHLVRWRLVILCAVIVAGLVAGWVVFSGEERTPTATPPTPSAAFSAMPTTPVPLPSTARPQLPGEMGISENLADLSPAELRQEVSLMKDVGTKWRRFDIRWDTVARKPGLYDYSRVQPAAEAVGRAGIRQVAILGYAPIQWAGIGSAPCSHTSPCAPASAPAAVAAYADFVGHTAQSFCAPHYGLRAIEIWNEPNISKYWPVPDPGLYTKYLKAGYQAVKDNCPRLLVLLGGLGDIPPEKCRDCISSVDFLQGVYERGGLGYFDAVSSHAYDPLQPERLHEVMVRHREGTKKVWVTEFAYPGVAPREQANYLNQTVQKLGQYAWIGPLFWFTLRDQPGSREQLGLADAHGRAKPALAAFARLAGAA